MWHVLQVLLTNDLAGSTPAADPTPAESALQPRQQQVHQQRQGLLLLLVILELQLCQLFCQRHCQRLSSNFHDAW
jgi:hypothetical protein